VVALLWAARRWHAGVVTLLLGKAESEESTLQEALHAAAQEYGLLGSERNVKFKGIDFFNQQFLVTSLIDAGADLNLCLNNQPLIYSVAHNANLTGVLKTLLENGADANKTSMAGKSALHVVAESVATSTAKPDCQNETAICLLLQYKRSASQPDNTGECPIYWAAYGLDLRLFRLYLKSGPDRDFDMLLRLTNHYRETLLHYAAAGCRTEVIEFLVAQGLDVNAKNSNGWTPILCALTAINRKPFSGVKSPTEAMQAAQYLLSHGTDASIATDEGWTPLYVLALHCDQSDIDVSGKVADDTRDLISRGANPEARARLLSPDATTFIFPFSLPWGYRLRKAMADSSTPSYSACPVADILGRRAWCRRCYQNTNRPWR
jgi:ankyrin repeat protein